MKKYLYILGMAACILTACTNLDETTYSQLPKSEFFQSESQLMTYSARPYTLLQNWGVEQSMWTLVMQLSNEVAVPKSYNGSWSEPRYRELQTHKMQTNNKLIRTAWEFCFNVIAGCNDVIYEVEQSGEMNKSKEKIIAEMKVLRAYCYMMAMDCWGNIPYSVSKKQEGYPDVKGRDFFFGFIEKEIKDNIEKLDDKPTAVNYGRCTRDMAHFLLAKLYLNAKVWIGKEMWEEAAAECKTIMDSGNYKLTRTYKENFDVHNEGSSEAIFAIPYSTGITTSDRNAFYPFCLTLNSDCEKIWNASGTWNGSFIGQPDFMASYDPADTRKSDTWLFGQVYDLNGNKWRIAVGVNKKGEPVYRDYILEDINIAEDKFSYGLSRTDGARIIKWTYQSDGSLTSYSVGMENDFILFRYADVVLMYVEALMRQGKTGEAAAVQEFKDIRTRAGLEPMSAADLTYDNFLWERQHELVMEGWGRQDLIRFGKYLDKWWMKEAGQERELLLPIPEEMRGANPKLQQNPGYSSAADAE